MVVREIVRDGAPVFALARRPATGREELWGRAAARTQARRAR
jgi:hypothetical protein